MWENKEEAKKLKLLLTVTIVFPFQVGVWFTHKKS
jgi:hypothetical protein